SVLDTAPTPPGRYPLSLHDALPISRGDRDRAAHHARAAPGRGAGGGARRPSPRRARQGGAAREVGWGGPRVRPAIAGGLALVALDRKSTRLNSSHVSISYAVFCLKK